MHQLTLTLTDRSFVIIKNVGLTKCVKKGMNCRYNRRVRIEWPRVAANRDITLVRKVSPFIGVNNDHPDCLMVGSRGVSMKYYLFL